MCVPCFHSLAHNLNNTMKPWLLLARWWSLEINKGRLVGTIECELKDFQALVERVSGSGGRHESPLTLA